MTSVGGLLDFLATPRTSKEMQEEFEVSQATASRLIRRAGDRIIRTGRGPATRYVAAGLVFELQAQAQLFVVTERGVVQQVGTLRALSDGRYLVEGKSLPRWLRGESDRGLFDDLPYFLYDLKPSGFLGRQIARRLSLREDFPSDPRVWSNRHIGSFLLQHADDLPGNIVVGEHAAKRVNRARAEVVSDREVEYPRLALQALSDDPPGSSAAGKQPKFAVTHRDSGHVIVKFSPSTRSAEARRWRDLLRAEHHALAVMADAKISTAPTTLHTIDGRVFLESQRFDRVGRKGRRGAISLTMVDAEFVGEAYGWSRVASALGEQQLLDQRSIETLVWAETFGTWIGNTDMHLGNVSLQPTDKAFEALPVYDMLPMAFAPIRGELPQPQLSPPIRTADNDAAWSSTGEAAVEFWQRIAADGELSKDMKHVAVGMVRRCREVLSS